MGEGDGERVRRVGRGDLPQPEKNADHGRHLRLLGPPTPCHGPLHPRRGVLRDREERARTHQERYAARVPQLRSCLRVLREEDRLDGRCVGSVRPHHLDERRLDLDEPLRDHRRRVRIDDPVGHVRQTCPDLCHEAPAEVACSRIETEDDHRGYCRTSLGERSAGFSPLNARPTPSPPHGREGGA